MPALVPETTYEAATPAARALWDAQIAAHGRMTNMKRTLAHSSVALGSLMTWYPLRDAVAAFTGERRALLFAHAISSATDCLICSTFFRRILKERGEDPDALKLDAADELLVAFGRALARDGSRLDDGLATRLKAAYTAPQLVELTAFGGLMVATNIFNNALGVPLDDYLAPFRLRPK